MSQSTLGSTPAAAGAGVELPRLTFHGLPREHASLLLSAGAPSAAVCTRLGRTSDAVTSELDSRLLDTELGDGERA